MSVNQAGQNKNKKGFWRTPRICNKAATERAPRPIIHLLISTLFLYPLAAGAVLPEIAAIDGGSGAVAATPGTSNSDPERVEIAAADSPSDNSSQPAPSNGVVASPLAEAAAPVQGEAIKVIRKALSKEEIEKKCAPRVADLKADCVVTHAGVVVNAVPNFICHFDTDKDGILDEKDKCPNTPPRTRVDDDGCAVPIVFPEPILYRINSEFDFNKFDLRPDALQTLEGLVKDLKGALQGAPVKIVGHTDSKGSDAYNIKLSKQRAGAVAKYLVDQGIPQNLISIDGKGEREPIATNSTDEGRALNRRIDVHVESEDETYKTGMYADGSGCPVPTTIDVYTLTAEFDTGSAVLKQEAIDGLDEILAKLRETPMEELIDVVGHTDSQGSDESNRLLSLARARSAADYLVQQGIPANYITVDGKGESQPIDDNGTPEGRRKNRRIEIKTR